MPTLRIASSSALKPCVDAFARLWLFAVWARSVWLAPLSAT